MAQKMGFKKNDTLTLINGKQISSVKSVNRIWRKTKPGDQFSYSLIRKGKEEHLTSPYLTSHDSKNSSDHFIWRKFQMAAIGIYTYIMAIFTFYPKYH